MGSPSREVSALELCPRSHPLVLDASRANYLGNRNSVEYEGLVLEVILVPKVMLLLKVTPLLTTTTKEKIEVIFGTWLPEST